MNKRNTSRRAERLLDAAADLIARYGYDKTTINDIAGQAGVAKGTVYLHWTSKEELFETLLMREIKWLMEDLLQRVEADPQGGSLARMYTHSLLALQANPLMRALYTQDSRVLGNYMHQQDKSRYTQRFGFGKVFIETLQKAGLVRGEVNPRALSYLLSIISYGFAGIESIIPAEEAPPLEETAAALEILLGQGVGLADGNMHTGREVLRKGVEMINEQYEAVWDGKSDKAEESDDENGN